MVLALIAAIGTEGGTGHVLEFSGDVIRAMTMEERMTVCNMAIEGGARAGLVAPDDTTVDFLHGRPFAPAGGAWDAAVEGWRALGAAAPVDPAVCLDGGAIEPMVTFGTSPGTGLGVGTPIPDPASLGDAAARRSLRRALDYMGLEPGRPMRGQPVDVVFIGSCTNGRLSDLRDAAAVLGGRRVHERVRMLVVPGSRAVKRAAEEEGLDRVFTAAGGEWREPGCSMCLAMNGDRLGPGELAVSTSNRNFEGRQGPGGRTVLASPFTAAAAAVTGAITDPRELMS